MEGNLFTVGAKTAKTSSEITTESPVAVEAGATLAVKDTSVIKPAEVTKLTNVAIATDSTSDGITVKEAQILDFTAAGFSKQGMSETAQNNLLTVWGFDIEGVSADKSVVLTFMIGPDFDLDKATV